MSELSIGNVFEVSVSAPGVGIGEMNTSNLAIISHEAYQPSFGTDGYKLYLDPAEAAKDFGSASVTAKLVNQIFSQRPNIRAGGGYCVVIPMLIASQTVNGFATAVSGQFTLNFNGQAIVIPYASSAATVQALVRAKPGFEAAKVTGTAGNLTFLFEGLAVPVPLMTVTGNTMVDGGAAPVNPVVTIVQASETPQVALARVVSLIHFFGVLYTTELSQTDMLAVAAIMQPLRKMAFLLGSQSADNANGGKLDLVRQGGFTHTRGLLYIDTVLQGLLFCAGYASRGMSVDFSGVNTTLTMHLKDIAGIIGNAAITQNILEQAKVSGADLYIKFDRNISKVFTSGANDYFDNVYNILSFVEALQVAGFNAFAQTPTKLPQTESGLDVIKGTSRKVCEKYVRNGFIAPGEWTSNQTFGPLEDFVDNIRQRGYYVYTTPIALQAVVDREARKAPLCQVAIKFAGAFHSGSLIITINE